MTCCAEKREIFLGGGALVVCSWGELRWGRRRRNRGGEGRYRGDILTFTDGFTDRLIPSVIPSARLMVNRARHCTELLVWIPRWFRRHFKWWIGHVTVRSCRFESLSDSIGKITRKNLHVNEPSFFNFEYSVRHSVGKYRPNVGKYRPNVFVGIYQRNDGRKKFCR